MTNTTGAVIRADLAASVEEARLAESFFIGQKVMPPFPVDAKDGSYPKIQIAEGELLTNLATVRNPDGSYNEVTRRWVADTYSTVDRGLEERVDDVTKADMARFFNAEQTAARLTLRNVLLDHEIRVAAATLSTSNYGAATNSAVAYTVANIATISFVTDVLAAIERVNDKGSPANTIVLSSTVLNRLKGATLVQNAVRGIASTDTQLNITADVIAKCFADNGITQCLVGRARYNTAKKGQTASLSNVWGTTYVWVGYVNPNAGALEEIGAGATLVWNKEGGITVTESYRDEKRRSNMVRVRQHTAEKCIDGTAGTLIATQWS